MINILTPDGVQPIKSNGRSPLFNFFFGIRDDHQFTHSDQSYAEAYGASILMWRCVNVVANTFASLPLAFETPDGKTLPGQHPALRYLGDSKGRLWRATAKDMLIWGRAFWLPSPRGIQRLNPITIEATYDYSGVTEFIQRMDGRVIGRWAPDEIVYFFDYNPQHDLAGLSPTQLALREINTEITLEQFVGQFFENGAMLSGVLTTDQSVQDADAERIQSRWGKVLRGIRNAGRTAFLDRGTSYQPITPPLKDLDMSAMDERNARKICQAYGVPLTLALATDAANYATSKEQRQSFYTETVLPFADVLLEEVNLQLMPSFGDYVVRVDKTDIEVLAEDRTEITTRASQAYAAGYITLNEARGMEGFQPLPNGDVLLMANQPVTIQQIEQGELPAPQQPSNPFGLLSASQSAPDSDKALGQSFSVVLHIGAHPELVALQKQLRTQIPNALEWCDPADFHVTLVIAPDVQQDQVAGLVTAVQGVPVPDTLNLNVGSLHTFDTLGSHALHFRIRRNAALLDYQAALVDACQDVGCTLSQHSHDYKPHITVGYLATPAPRITYRTALTVSPESVQATYEEAEDTYTVVWEQRFAAKSIILTPPRHALAVNDLKNWRKKAAKSRAASFTSDFIPPALAAFIRMDLTGGADVKATFDAAIKQLDDPDDTLPTPEEFEAYWRDIGDLYNDFAQAFEGVYDGLRERIAARLRNQGADADYSDILANYADKLRVRLEEPLARVYLAGVGRGNDLLTDARLIANPNKNAVALVWDIFNPLASQFAERRAGELVRGITDTTREAFQAKIAAWIEKGGALDELARAIEGDLAGLNIPSGWSPAKVDWATSPERAMLIAQTETTNAFNRGVEARWSEAGVTKFRWRTQNDGLVCGLCRALNNRVGTIADGVVYEGKSYKPAAHPGCRCFEAPEED